MLIISHTYAIYYCHNIVDNTLTLQYTSAIITCWMMPYPIILVSIPLQYRSNNRIASCYNNEYFQHCPTLDTMSDILRIPCDTTTILCDTMSDILRIPCDTTIIPCAQ